MLNYKKELFSILLNAGLSALCLNTKFVVVFVRKLAPFLRSVGRRRRRSI